MSESYTLTKRVKMEELHNAIREGDLERLRCLVRSDFSVVDAADDKGKTAVSIAIESGKPDIVKWLIDNGCRLSKTIAKSRPVPSDVGGNSDGNERSEQKTVRRQENTVGSYETKQINEESDMNTFYPPMLSAVHTGSCEMVKIVLESHRAHVEDSFKNFSPLMKACSEGHADIVALLLKYGADVNGTHTPKNGDGDYDWFYRPLYHAVNKKSTEIVEMLVSHGAMYLQVVPIEMYSFHVAAQTQMSQRSLGTLIELAVRLCQPTMVTLLIDFYHSEITDLGRYYALLWSVNYQKTGMTDLLLEKLYPPSYNMELDEFRGKYQQVLRIAVRECPKQEEHVPILLLERFGKKLFPEEEGFFIILHSAVLRSLPQLVTKLLEIAKDPTYNYDVTRYESWPDLCSAALYYGNKQILCALYDNGFLDLSTHNDGENAFFEAIFSGRNGSTVYEVLSWLVECGLDPSAPDNNRMQPIHAAVTHRLNSAVDALCCLGVDANARMGTDDLPSPLHLQLNLRVLQLGCDLNLDLIKVLVGHGADLAMENRKGYTPISILFWLLYANIRIQDSASAREEDAGQRPGQDAGGSDQPDVPHDPSRLQDTASPDNNTPSGQDQSESETGTRVSTSFASNERTETVANGPGGPSVAPGCASVTAAAVGPLASRQDDTTGSTQTSAQNGASASVPPDVPTYLRPDSPWRALIEILVDKFGVELFTMGAMRLTGHQQWKKVYASLVHAGIDMCHLPTLRSMCWVSIRKQLGGVHFCKKVNQLPLPEVMKTYLKTL